MPTDPRVDVYIEHSRDFAKPILIHIRALVHRACPDVGETIKWSFPNFEYKGMFCHMASFNEHCSFGFWKQALIDKSDFPAAATALGSFGRITSLADLPDDERIIELIVEAARLNDLGIKSPKPTKDKKDLIVPEILVSALATNELAAETFSGFSYSKKKEYVEWITEAKTDATRDKRLNTAIEWLAEGKARNWKYEKC